MKCYCDDPGQRMPDFVQFFEVRHKDTFSKFVVLQCETCLGVYVERVFE